MMNNINDMRVGDFLYLLDKMHEECCEQKRCFECKYYEYCNIDISDIESMSIREAVEGYAEANGLIKHMNYVHDKKWIPVSERLPEEFEFVLVYLHTKIMTVASRTTNGTFYNIQGDEIWPPIAWMPLPEPYTPYKGESVFHMPKDDEV